MSKSNGVLVPCIVLLLICTSLSSPVVYGSSISAQETSFNRPDPLHHFRPYNGTYDIRDKHYWASAAFTGVHGYAMAGIWTLFGLGFGMYMIVRNQRGSSVHIRDCLGSHCFWTFVFALLFTFLAIVASSFVLAANHSTLRRTKKLKDTILTLGGNAQGIIMRVTKALTEMESLLLPYDPNTSHRLNSTIYQLGVQSEDVQCFVQTSGHAINLAIHTSYAVHLAVVTVNMVLLVAALAYWIDGCFASAVLLLHWYHPGFIIIIFICWILTTLFWVLTGFDYFLHIFAEDTCLAFKEFEQTPHNNSLSSIFPCEDPESSDKITVDIGSTVHNFIAMLNIKMTELNNRLELDGEEDDLQRVWTICNPFSGAPDYKYTPKQCSKDTISIDELPDVIVKLTCYDTTGTCKGSTRLLPEASYIMLWSYSHSIQNLLGIYPDLQSLTQCSFVTDTFSDVVLHQCRPFRVSFQLLWASILSLSIFMVMLVLTWVVKANHDSGKCFSTCSLVPKEPNPL